MVSTFGESSGSCLRLLFDLAAGLVLVVFKTD